jgi:hypothetical protein
MVILDAPCSPSLAYAGVGHQLATKQGTIGNDDTNTGGYERADGNGGGAILHLIFMLYMRHCYMWLDLTTFFWPDFKIMTKTMYVLICIIFKL